MEELLEYLQSNKKIEIEKLLPNKKIKRYKTAFYQVSKEDFQFFRPKENESFVDFRFNEVVRILVYTKDGVFTFKTKVLKCGIKTFKLQIPENYKKIQRRGLLRVDLPLVANIEYELDSKLIRKELKIINISGSGVSFNIDDDLSKTDNILIAFNIEEKIIEARLKIIEIRKNLKQNIEKYRISAQFVSLNNHEIEHIIKSCIKYQIKMRKSSKG
ncbi:MAG: PilZ domain-containing protein [Candidatus Gastranaerophilales bacterium]|nr:PilZ domain-containing protein [Candidatus Gastranaerophilales bacterium]